MEEDNYRWTKMINW